MTSNELLFKNAKHYFPGGVNSPVRAFNAVKGVPVFAHQGKGAYVIAENGQSYIDYIGSWGPLILGHNHPNVRKAVHDAVDHGLGFGMPTKKETELAELICELMPHIEQLRFVNSGTEATMTAIRLARGYTHRNKIIKFEGCYHGHSDSLLVKAGSGALTFSTTTSAGVPEDFIKHTLVAEFNNIASVAALFEEHPNSIAAVIIEPMAGNMNFVKAKPSFLQGLRALCDQYNSILIFDEVMTGFRIGLGGAQAHYNIKPDLTTLGKIIGGGLPVGAFGGKKAIMQYLSPEGPVYQAGTLSGNPIAISAGLATLQEIVSHPNFFKQLSQLTGSLVNGLQLAANEAQIPFYADYQGGMFGFFFSSDTICSYEQVMRSNRSLFKPFFHGMLQRGIHFAPSAFEAGFVSMAHGEKEIQQTIAAAKDTLASLKVYVSDTAQLEQ